MKNILITEATGKVGGEILNQLISLNGNYNVYAAVNNIEKFKHRFSALEEDRLIYFDIEDEYSFKGAFNNMDTLCLILPTHIADVKKYFIPLLKRIKESKIREVIFLSVQGVENNKYIPHNKVETLLKNSKIDYVFLRPSYFMQNLKSTLYKDIVENNTIKLPAGLAKFNWVDVQNVAEIAVHLLIKFKNYRNNVVDISGNENLNFYDVVDIFNDTLEKNVTYESQSLLNFYKHKKNQDLTLSQIFILILLHFIPRFKEEPIISQSYQTITSKSPNSLRDFLLREKEYFKN